MTVFSKMNRFHLWPHRYLCGSFLFFKKDFVHDRVEDPPEFVPKTGIERVIKEFSDPEPGYPSKALISVTQLMGGSFLFGFLVGGMKRGNHAYSDFMISHQHVKFITPYEAKRKLQDTVFLHFIKGGVFWGAKVAIFTGVYSFCVIAIPVYRNTKEGILEYIIGGALAGGLSRLYLGWKAAMAAATFVSIFTGFVGLITYLSSTPMSEIMDLQYSWYEWRRKHVEASYKEGRNKMHGYILPQFMDMRDRRLQEKDNEGYSEAEAVFIAMTDPDEVSESTEPEVKDEKSNDQVNAAVTAVHETTSTNK